MMYHSVPYFICTPWSQANSWRWGKQALNDQLQAKLRDSISCLQTTAHYFLSGRRIQPAPNIGHDLFASLIVRLAATSVVLDRAFAVSFQWPKWVKRFFSASKHLPQRMTSCFSILSCFSLLFYPVGIVVTRIVMQVFVSLCCLIRMLPLEITIWNGTLKRQSSTGYLWID